MKIKLSPPKERLLELSLLFVILGVSVFLLVHTLATDAVARRYIPKQSLAKGAAQSFPTASKVVLPKVIYNVNGSIQELSQDSLVLNNVFIPKQSPDGQIEQTVETRKVKVTGKTKFSQLNIVTDKATGRQIIQETKIDFVDLKIGDSVEAIANDNIWEAGEFEASQIRLTPKLARF